MTESTLIHKQSNRPAYPDAIPPSVGELITQMMETHRKPAAPPPGALNDPEYMREYVKLWTEYEMCRRLYIMLTGVDPETGQTLDQEDDDDELT